MCLLIETCHFHLRCHLLELKGHCALLVLGLTRRSSSVFPCSVVSNKSHACFVVSPIKDFPLQECDLFMLINNLQDSFHKRSYRTF